MTEQFKKKNKNKNPGTTYCGLQCNIKKENYSYTRQPEWTLRKLDLVNYAEWKKPILKGYILCDYSIYVPFSKWENCRDGEQISGWKEVVGTGEQVGVSQRAFWGMLVVMETFCALTISKSTCWLWLYHSFLRCYLPLGGKRLKGTWELSALFLSVMWIYGYFKVRILVKNTGEMLSQTNKEKIFLFPSVS